MFSYAGRWRAGRARWRIAIADDLVRPSAVTADTTIISISVSVPVLSEQMRDTEPSISTAGSRRMMALRWAKVVRPVLLSRRLAA